jgi:hypothetical protein
MLHVTFPAVHPAGVAPKPRLSPDQIDQLRVVARRVLADRYGSNRSRLAGDLEVSQPSLSRFLSGKQGIAEPLARRLLEIARVPPETLDLEPPSGVRRTVDADPRWLASVTAAKADHPYLPEWAWVEAGRAIVALEHLSPSVALHLAMAVAAGRSPERRAS